MYMSLLVNNSTQTERRRIKHTQNSIKYTDSIDLITTMFTVEMTSPCNSELWCHQEHQ